MDSMKCVKIQNSSVLVDNLNITSSVSNRTIVFWNKYQILLFNELKYENLVNDHPFIYLSEFRIAQVILSTNYLICLDTSGNIHVSPLKFKQSHKRIKSIFQQREEGILCIEDKEDETFSLKKEENDLYFCIHKISSEFQLQKKIKISIDICLINSRKKYIYYTRKLNETEFIHIKQIFKTNDRWNNQIIVIMSFDKLSIYALLVCFKSQQDLVPVKLLTCPSEINNVSIIEDSYLNVIVSLSSGTIIKIPLNNDFKIPSIIHLNTAIDKFLAYNNTMIYSDGITIWKSENTFSESNISFRQFLLRHVKDFIKVADQIICTTYSNLIYLIPLEDDVCYLKPPSIDEYCSSEHLINNPDYLNKIFEEINRNQEIIKKVKREENYLTILALSNRKDVMDDMIKYNVIVFENYEDILKEDILITLTNSIDEYFGEDSLYFLINITTTCHLQQTFSNILSNIFGNLKIHITLTSDDKILKTNSIKVQEQLKSLNIVLPLNTQMLNLANITIKIMLVTHIPAALNEKETLWTTLHCKKIVLNSEHFIKSNFSKNKIQFLKDTKKSITDLIYESAKKHHGHLFQINSLSNSNNAIKWPFYIKLPNNYQELLKNINLDNFNTRKANYLSNELSSEEFLKSRSNLCFIIANETVEVELLNDGLSHPSLRVTAKNPQIALGIRNFFSSLIHNFKSYDKEFVSIALYDSIENMEGIIKTCLPNELYQISSEEFINLFDQYQRNIIGAFVI